MQWALFTPLRQFAKIIWSPQIFHDSCRQPPPIIDLANAGLTQLS